MVQTELRFAKISRIAQLAIVLLSAWTTVSQAQDNSSTKAEFEEFSRAMMGRFRGDILLIHDWPGHQKKKGERISGVRVTRPVANGEAFISTDSAGAGVFTELFVFNALTKRIEGNGVSNGGTTWSSVVSKESPNRWKWTLKGSLGDGKPTRGTGAWVFLEEGKRFDLVSDDFWIGDTKAGKLHDRYHRMSADAKAEKPSGDNAAKLLQTMQGTWVRDYQDNQGRWTKREKVIDGNTEKVTDYDQENNELRTWSSEFEVRRLAGKYNVFSNKAVFYIFDVDENYWYEIHDLKASAGMLPAFRRVKSITNLNENRLGDLEKWVGNWRGEFTPKPLKGYTDGDNGIVEVEFDCKKNRLGTTITFSWIASRQEDGEVVATVNGYVAWSPTQNSYIFHYINSSGVNVSGTIKMRGKTHIMNRKGSGPDGDFAETCTLEFKDANTMVHSIFSRVHRGQASEDATPVTLKKMTQ